MTKAKVTFDSNVWENIVDEAKRATQEVYRRLYEAIKGGVIAPFFFEGIAVQESIPKGKRKEYVGGYKAPLSIQVNGEPPHVTKGSDFPEITEYLRHQISNALKIGFKFITFRRMGAVRLDITPEYFAPNEVYPLKERLARSCRCARFVDSLGAGKARLHSRLAGDASIGIVEQTARDTSLSEKQYAKDFAEWVDGDAIAAHYGYGIDYFCTNDKARGAGGASVFSSSNLEKLREEFGLNVVSPQELLELLRTRKQEHGKA
jgi:hypothetical protein